MSLAQPSHPRDCAAPETEAARAACPIFVPERVARVGATTDIIRVPYRLHNQEIFGSCMAQAPTAYIEDQVRYAVSGVKPWRDARKLQGDEFDIDQGTTPSMLFQALRECGWSPWHPGEDSDKTEAFREGNPADDVWGDATRQDGSKLTIAQIVGTVDQRYEAVMAALLDGWGVIFTSGLRDPFFSLGVGELATTRHIGGDVNGHAQRFLGAKGGMPYVQNSWGAAWGGMVLPDGLVLNGCYQVERAVLAVLWDLIAFKVTAPAG